MLTPMMVAYRFPLCSEGEPPTKKPKTTSVVVEQAGQSDKVVIDHIPDTDSVFEEVEEEMGGIRPPASMGEMGGIRPPASIGEMGGIRPPASRGEMGGI